MTDYAIGNGLITKARKPKVKSRKPDAEIAKIRITLIPPANAANEEILKAKEPCIGSFHPGRYVEGMPGKKEDPTVNKVADAICTLCHQATVCKTVMHVMDLAIEEEYSELAESSRLYMAAPYMTYGDIGGYSRETLTKTMGMRRKADSCFIEKVRYSLRALALSSRSILSNLTNKWYDDSGKPFDFSLSKKVVEKRAQVAAAEIAVAKLKRELRIIGETQTVVVDVVTRMEGAITVAAEVDSVSRAFNKENIKIFTERSGESTIVSLSAASKQEVIDSLTEYLMKLGDK